METKKTFFIGPYTISINLKLTQEKGGPIFSCMGLIKEFGQETEGGQCRESINEIFKKAEGLYEYDKKDRETREKINYLREKHHLNNCHAGTRRQEEILKKSKVKNKYDYKKSIQILKRHNLANDNGYKYGTAWLYRPITNKDLRLIKYLITGQAYN